MSTLAESFLHDLESDEEEEEEEPQVQVPAAGLGQEDAAQAAVDEDEECGDIDAMDMEAVKPDPLKQVAVLCGSRRLRDHLELLRNASSNNGSTDANGERHVDTMLTCNKMIVEVDDEISAVGIPAMYVPLAETVLITRIRYSSLFATCTLCGSLNWNGLSHPRSTTPKSSSTSRTRL